MTTIERNASNDIFIGPNGQLQLCDGKLCKAQILEAAILTVTGELQLDIYKGIPYFTTVFLSPSKIDIWSKYVKLRVLEFDWVKNITEFTYDFNHTNNSISYNMSVVVDEGEITIGSTHFNTGIAIPNGNGGNINDMESLIDSNGNFYLPVYKKDGIQYYRKMTSIKDAYGATTQLSNEEYYKDENGIFVTK